MNLNKRGLDTPMLLLTGAAIGYGLGIFASDQQRKQMTDKIKQVASKVDWDSISQQLFGKSAEETKDTITGLTDKVTRKGKQVAKKTRDTMSEAATDIPDTPQL